MKKLKETKEKIISLIKLSDPVSLTLKKLPRGNMFLAESLSTISEMENFTELKLRFDTWSAFRIDESYATKLKALHVKNCDVANIDRLTSLVELRLVAVILSDKEWKNVASLPRLKILRLEVVHDHEYHYGEFGHTLFSSGLVRLTELDFSGSDYIDEDILGYLKRLRQLRKLNLKSTGITDTDLVHISNLRELIELDISHNDITDSGLKNLMNLAKLTKLDISDNDITNDGIEYLVHLGNLKMLDLTGTQVNWSTSHFRRLIAAGCFV